MEENIDVVKFSVIKIDPLGIFKNPQELIVCLRGITKQDHDPTHHYVSDPKRPGTCINCCWIDPKANSNLFWKVKILINNQKKYPITRNNEWVVMVWLVAKILGLKTNLSEEFTKKCDFLYENMK